MKEDTTTGDCRRESESVESPSLKRNKNGFFIFSVSKDTIICFYE